MYWVSVSACLDRHFLKKSPAQSLKNCVEAWVQVEPFFYDSDPDLSFDAVFRDTVNFAARLSSIAGPNQIVVDLKTFTRVR